MNTAAALQIDGEEKALSTRKCDFISVLGVLKLQAAREARVYAQGWDIA